VTAKNNNIKIATVKIATIPFFPREPYGCFAYLAAKSKCKVIISRRSNDRKINYILLN